MMEFQLWLILPENEKWLKIYQAANENEKILYEYLFDAGYVEAQKDFLESII